MRSAAPSSNVRFAVNSLTPTVSKDQRRRTENRPERLQLPWNRSCPGRQSDPMNIATLRTMARVEESSSS